MALVRVVFPLVLAVTLLTPTISGQLTPTVSAQEAAPDAVVDAYAAARVRGDVDALLPLFADDAAVVDRFGGSHTGTEAIRELLQLNASRGMPVSITDRRVDGTHASWVERVSGRGTTFSLTVEAVVQHGRVRLLAFGGGGLEAAPPVVVSGGTGLPAWLGLATVLLVFAAGVSVLSLAPSRRSPAQDSHLRGSLVAGLRQWCERCPDRAAQKGRAVSPGHAS